MPEKKSTKFNLGEARVPPQNIEAEMSVLGSLMLDKDAIIKIADLVNPDDFYKDANRLIYETMNELYEDREPIDVLSLSNKLEEKKQLEKIGGSGYLTDLVNSVPTASNVVHYAKVVQKKSLLRKLISAASDIIELGYEEAEDVEKVLDEAEQKLFRVSQKFVRKKFQLGYSRSKCPPTSSLTGCSRQKGAWMPGECALAGFGAEKMKMILPKLEKRWEFSPKPRFLLTTQPAPM